MKASEEILQFHFLSKMQFSAVSTSIALHYKEITILMSLLCRKNETQHNATDLM